eukprot:COSAG05_NODE_399_length_10267_cov_21.327301_3_plen_73_part_00
MEQVTQRLQALRAFNEIDADGSGLLDRQEMLLLNTALDPSAKVMMAMRASNLYVNLSRAWFLNYGCYIYETR